MNFSLGSLKGFGDKMSAMCAFDSCSSYLMGAASSGQTEWNLIVEKGVSCMIESGIKLLFEEIFYCSIPFTLKYSTYRYSSYILHGFSAQIMF